MNQYLRCRPLDIPKTFYYCWWDLTYFFSLQKDASILIDIDQQEQNSNRRQSPVTPAGFKILLRFLMSNLGYLFERGLLSVDTRD